MWVRFLLFWQDFKTNRIALLALLIVLLMLFAAIGAGFLAQQDVYDLATLNLSDARQEPGFRNSEGFVYWLGTDAQGRDILSAILYGLRISIEMGLLSGFLAFCMGTLMGVSAAFVGGRLEALLMRIIDLQLSFPAMLLALMLTAIMGAGKTQLLLALVAAQYAYFARAAHGAATVERHKDYIEAALSTPLSSTRVLLRHIIPNCLPSLIVVATVQVANAVSLEATLSFLGLGLPPTEPSLGGLIANGFEYLLSGRYWISIYPGLALITLIVSLNLVGDHVRDILNPRLQR